MIPREAIQLAHISGKPITHLAHELGISDRIVYQWHKEEMAEQDPEAGLGSEHQIASSSI